MSCSGARLAAISLGLGIAARLVASFTISSATSEQAEFKIISRPLDAVGSSYLDDPYGASEGFGSAPHVDGISGMVVPTANGKVVHYPLDQTGASVLATGTDVFTEGSGRFVPAAICNGIIAVAAENLKIFQYSTVTSSWSLVQQIGAAGSNGRFDSRRLGRRMAFHCDGADSVIAASTGGPSVGFTNTSFRPRIHVFRVDGAFPTFRHAEELTLDNFTLSDSDSAGLANKNIFSTSPGYMLEGSLATPPTGYDTSTSVMERLDASKNLIVSVAAYFQPVTGASAGNGFPVFMWDHREGETTFASTRDERACQTSSVRTTAAVGIAALDFDGAQADRALAVSCPAGNGQAPTVEFFQRTFKQECGETVLALTRFHTLSAAVASGFPGFASFSTFGVYVSPFGSSGGFGAGEQANSTAPGVAVIKGSITDLADVVALRMVIGDPGYDSLTNEEDLDVGRAFLLTVAADRSSGALVWSVDYESAIAPAESGAGEMYGAQGASAVQQSTTDLIAMAAPGAATPSLRFASSARSSLQVLPFSESQAFGSPDFPFQTGATVDSDDRWVAISDEGSVRIFANADAVNGFGNGTSATQNELGTFHSVILQGQSPFVSGFYPAGMTDVYRGVPIVRFLPAVGTYDGRPRLLVLSPKGQNAGTAPTPVDAWELRLYRVGPTAAAAGSSTFSYATADAEDLVWSMETSMDMDAGFAPCSRLFGRCNGNTIDCFELMVDACASQILLLEQPRNATALSHAEQSAARQAASLGGGTPITPLAPSRGSATIAGLGSPLPGCEDGVTVGLPDAAGTPSIVMVCVHGTRSPLAVGATAMALHNGILPTRRSDGRLVIGQACESRGVAACVLTGPRAATVERLDLVAGTTIASGVVAGELVVVANNDANRLELFNFNGTRFVPVAAGTGTAAAIHPMPCDRRQDVAVLDHLDAIITGVDGTRLSVNNIGLTPAGVMTIVSSEFLTGPAVTDPCGNRIFGSSIIADHSLLAVEGLLPIITSNVGLAGCTGPTVSSGGSDYLTLYTVRADGLQLAALHDDGRDAAAPLAEAMQSREATLTAEGAAVSTRLTLSGSRYRAATALSRGGLFKRSGVVLNALHTFELSGVSAHFQESGAASPFAISASGAVLRSGAWSVTRTAESGLPWHIAAAIAANTPPYNARRALFGINAGSTILDPLHVLRAGSDMPRIFLQTGAGVVQIDRRIVTVSHTSVGSDAKAGSLLNPLRNLDSALLAACASTPAACDPVSIIGAPSSPTDSPIYATQALGSTNLAATDTARTEMGVQGTITYVLPLGNRLAGFNVTLRGAGMESTRLVLQLPQGGRDGTDEALSIGSIELHDVTVEGGATARGSGFLGLQGGGILNIIGSAAQRTRARLHRVRLFDGRSRSSGGAIAASNADIVAVDCVIANTAAAESGGAIYLTSASSAVLVRSTIVNTTASEQDGGAIVAITTSAVTLDQVFVGGGNSGNNGGGIALTSSEAALLRSEMSGNKASASGGAISASFGRIIASQTAFEGNQALGADGGAVNVVQSSGTPERSSRFLDCSFVSNGAEGSGGAIRGTTRAEFLTRRCGFAYNIAASGGAVSLATTSAVWSDGGSLIHGNAASSTGGGVSANSFASVGLVATDLSRNAAAAAGGSVACTEGALLTADTSSTSAASVYRETAAEVSARGAASFAAVPGMTVTSGISPLGAGIYALACRGKVRGAVVQQNSLGISGSRPGAVREYLTKVAAGTGTARFRGAFVAAPFTLHMQLGSGMTMVFPPPTLIIAPGAMMNAPFFYPAAPSLSTVFSSMSRLAALPPTTASSVVPAVTAAVSSGSTQTFTDVTFAASVEEGGAGIYAGTLEASSSSLELDSVVFRQNSASGGSGGCILGAGVTDNKDCTSQPASCFVNGRVTTKANYLRLTNAVTLANCTSVRGAAVYWTHVPFSGAADIAVAAGQALFSPSGSRRLAHDASRGLAGTLQVTQLGNGYTSGFGKGTVLPAPAVETVPAYLRLAEGSRLETVISPGDPIVPNSSAIAFELVDAYGYRGLARSFTVAASVFVPSGRGLVGTTSATAGLLDSTARIPTLALEAPAGNAAVTVTFSLSTDLGVAPMTSNVAMRALCTGRRSLTSGDTACTPCGMTETSDGRTCSGCPSGFVIDTSTTAPPRGRCVRCSDGQEAAAGACTPCNPGRFSNPSTGLTCTPCAAGFVAATAGASNCTACSAGSTSDASRLTCTACASTEVAPSGSPCVSCSPGQGRSEDRTTCVNCLAGFFSGDGSTCTSCPAGRASASPQSTSCLPCSSGSVSVAAGLASCSSCGAGTRSSSDATSCLSCLINEVAVPGSSACTACPAGTIPSVSKTFCEGCTAGTIASVLEGKCNPCAAGTFSPANASTCSVCTAGFGPTSRQSGCERCAKGTISTAGVCSSCPPGRFSSVVGGTTCSLCGIGRFASAEGADACTTCIGNTATGSSGSTTCSSCGAGQVAISAGGFEKAACGTCQAGTRPETDSTGALSCARCSAGTVSTSGTECTACGTGTIADQNRTSCLACATDELVTCTGATLTLTSQAWWTPGQLQVDVDVEALPWVFLPASAEMHECPDAGSCNVTVNSVVARARTEANALARTNLSTAERGSRVLRLLRSNLANGNDGVACAEGHAGPRCALCESGFSRVAGATSCVRCLDSGTNWLIVAAGVLVVSLAASYLVYNTHKANVKGKAGSNVTPGLIRIVTNYLKIQSTLGDFKARAPAVIMAIRSGASTVSSGLPLDVGPVACAFALNYERQLLGVLIMPLGIILAVAVVCVLLYSRAAYCPWCLNCKRRKDSGGLQQKLERPGSAALASKSASKSGGGHHRRSSSGSPSDNEAASVEHHIQEAADAGTSVDPMHRAQVRGKYTLFFISAVVILLFLIYSMLVKQVFTAWSLYPTPIAGKRYLAADFAVSIDSDAYTRITIMAIVGVIVWVIGIPAIAILILFRLRHNLLDDTTVTAFGFLYAGYNIGTAAHLNQRTIRQATAVLGHLETLAEAEQTLLEKQRTHTIGSSRAPSSDRGEALRLEDVDPTPKGARSTAIPGPASRPRHSSPSAAIAPADSKEDDDEGSDGRSSARVRPAMVNSMVASASFMVKQRRQSQMEMRGTNVGYLKEIIHEFEETVSGDDQSWWFWEVVVLARLVLVTMVAVFVEDVFVQSYLALIIVVAAMVLHLAAHPYSDSSLNFAETLGLLTVVVTQLGSLLWALDGTTDLADLDQTFVTVVLIIVNILVLVVFAVMLILSVLGQERIERIPLCGACCSRAFFRERNLRRQFLRTQDRQEMLSVAHDKSLSSTEQRARLRGMQAAAAAATAGAAAAGTAGVISQLTQ